MAITGKGNVRWLWTIENTQIQKKQFHRHTIKTVFVFCIETTMMRVLPAARALAFAKTSNRNVAFTALRMMSSAAPAVKVMKDSNSSPKSLDERFTYSFLLFCPPLNPSQPTQSFLLVLAKSVQDTTSQSLILER